MQKKDLDSFKKNAPKFELSDDDDETCSEKKKIKTEHEPLADSLIGKNLPTEQLSGTTSADDEDYASKAKNTFLYSSEDGDEPHSKDIDKTVNSDFENFLADIEREGAQEKLNISQPQSEKDLVVDGAREISNKSLYILDNERLETAC